MIDSHCHLAGEEFVADRDAVIARAKAAGVERALVILAAEDDAEWARAAEVAATWPGVRFAVGVHPHQAHVFASDPAAAARAVAARLDSGRPVHAIGEIGLDYHYDFSPPEVQKAVFRAQLTLAQARRLPVVIHTREADDDTFALIGQAQARGPLSGVFHCFTGDAAAAARALETGFFLSIPGIVTFPGAVELRGAIRHIPLDRLLVETDAPYLAPVPHRGKRNEPAWVAETAATVARERGLGMATLDAALNASFDRLFGDAVQTPSAQGLSGDTPR